MMELLLVLLLQEKALPEPGMDPTKAPGWWLTKPDEIRKFLDSLKGVEVEEIGKSAGGRPLVAASWGAREMLPGRTSSSLASAIAGGDPAAFYGKGDRWRQVVLFVGAAHGTEFDGTVAALHFLNVLVTGKDLLGREHPKMAEEGRKHRFIIIPLLNVDGRARALDHVSWINVNADYFSMITQGLKKDGTIFEWPTSKLVFPIPVNEFRVLGTYFNDAGVNLVYDSPFGGDCQPETTALLRFCRREMPDLVIFSHSNNGSLVEPPSSYIPVHFKQKSDQIGAVVGMRCNREGYKKSSMPRSPTTYAGDQYYHSDGVYHASGALPLVVEFPCGWKAVPETHRDILDIGLAVLDEISQFGNRYRFRPRDPVKK